MFLVAKKYAKPFLKWAGGKTQLLEEFSKYFPIELKNGEIENYYEPFLGSGTVFFYVVQNYEIKYALLSDINEELILTFDVVKKDVSSLITELKNLKENYYSLNGNEQELLFYKIREFYNQEKSKIDFRNYSAEWIKRAAQMIFLNKTCFNGLFRLNRKGEFNVPFGRYKNPGILDEEEGKGNLVFNDELGFIILHRAGDYLLLLVTTWRLTNEMWESIFLKNAGVSENYKPLKFDNDHKGTYCVWELSNSEEKKRKCC